MLPDLSIEQRNGWLVLGGATVVLLGVLWYVWDGSGPLSDEVEKRRLERDKTSGSAKQDMRQLVEKQHQANEELRRTIEALKGESGFEVLARFAIPKTEPQPGYLFKRRFIEIRQALREKAAPRSIRYDENIGFGADDKVPDDAQAPYLMAMLQLTEKAVTIAINTPSPLESMSITHAPAVDAGPDNRPVLLREYPLELKVHGTLKDILWILHRISQVDGAGADIPAAGKAPAGAAGSAVPAPAAPAPDSPGTPAADAGGAHDYPLILRGLVIQSENVKPSDQLTQLDATFRIAGMQFLTPEEREHLGGGTGTRAVNIRPAASGPRFQSHP
jgi:hypothetical protein